MYVVSERADWGKCVCLCVRAHERDPLQKLKEDIEIRSRDVTTKSMLLCHENPGDEKKPSHKNIFCDGKLSLAIFPQTSALGNFGDVLA